MLNDPVYHSPPLAFRVKDINRFRLGSMLKDGHVNVPECMLTDKQPLI